MEFFIYYKNADIFGNIVFIFRILNNFLNHSNTTQYSYFYLHDNIEYFSWSVSNISRYRKHDFWDFLFFTISKALKKNVCWQSFHDEVNVKINARKCSNSCCLFLKLTNFFRMYAEISWILPNKCAYFPFFIFVNMNFCWSNVTIATSVVIYCWHRFLLTSSENDAFFIKNGYWKYIQLNKTY